MAVCPYCMEQKSMFASKCPSCLSEITFGQQLIAQCVYVGTILLTLTFLVVLLKACSG